MAPEGLAHYDLRPPLEVLADHPDEQVRLEVDLYWAAAAEVALVGLLVETTAQVAWRAFSITAVETVEALGLDLGRV